MLLHLHRLSGFLFYLWGISFFTAYLLFQNQIGGRLPRLWLEVGDLPFLLLGMIYGGASLYLSVKPREKNSATLALFIVIPLIIVFGLFVTMNFWGPLEISDM